MICSVEYILRKIPVKALFPVWLLVLSLLIQGPLPALVVCLEQNGDIGIESTLNGQCGKDEIYVENYGLSFESGMPGSVEHCDSCVDIPIYISSGARLDLLPSGVKSHQVNALADIDPLLGLPDFIGRSVETRHFQRRRHESATLLSIRTVVLIV